MSDIENSTPSLWGEHLEYTSIEDCSDRKSIDLIFEQNLNTLCNWVVSEKINGCNFSFITNGQVVECAKRTSDLNPDDNFYNYQSVKQRLEHNMKALHHIMKERGLLRGEGKVVVFGELCGGIYNHKDVEPEPDAKAVQADVQYSPRTQFFSFDIYDGLDFIDVTTMHDLFRAAELPYLEPLFTGSFEEAIKYDPQFETTVPAYLGLPSIPDNFAEGVIIRPVIPLRTDAGDRVMLKNKNPKFAERTHGTSNGKLKEMLKSVESNNTDGFAEALQMYINGNRLTAVVSKEGEVTNENRMRIAELLVEDALRDFLKEEMAATRYASISEKQQTLVKNKCKGIAMKLVSEVPEGGPIVTR